MLNTLCHLSSSVYVLLFSLELLVFVIGIHFYLDG